MSVLAENGRRKLWFGTVDQMQWMPTPNRGANVSGVGWAAGGELLNGGAFQLGSFNSARNYVFEWPSSSTREDAELLKSYADGTYGRGLIYFIDPLNYDTNILPAMWADPSMAIRSESNSLVPGVTPTATPTSGNASLKLPVQSAYYDLTSIGVSGPSTLDDSNSVFVPVPEGYNMLLGAFYSSTGTSGVYYSPVFRGGSVSGQTRLNPLTGTSASPLNTVVAMSPGQVGVRVWVGKTASGAASLTLTAMAARLFPVGGVPTGSLSWSGGQGHSGCRFSAYPTLTNNSGVNGGQMSFAASFREVGSWVMG